MSVTMHIADQFGHASGQLEEKRRGTVTTCFRMAEGHNEPDVKAKLHSGLS